MNTPDPATTAILDEAIVATVIERVHKLGVELEAFALGGEPPAELACCIGFGGDRIQGAFCSTASQAFVRAVWPSDAPAAMSPDDLADWYGELVNQLFGGMRARLSCRGFEVYQGPPMVVRGIGLHRQPSPGAFTREHVFRGSRAELGELRVLFDVFFRGPLDLTTTLSSEEPQAASGHVRIF